MQGRVLNPRAAAGSNAAVRPFPRYLPFYTRPNDSGTRLSIGPSPMSDMSISPILLSAKEAKRPYALARSSLDTAMQVRALGWGFRKTAAQLYCPNTLESCMLGYLEVKSTKRFDDWYASLRDKIAKKAVDRRIARVAAGLFGDVNRVGKISEFRIDVGPGYRVYFTTVNGEIIFLLAGGDKRTQQADIDTATRLAENLEL